MALLGLAVAPRAEAQTASGSGWALNRYEPAPMGDAFFLAEHPWYSSTRVFSVGLYGDYANNPLRLNVTNTGTGSSSTSDDITGMFVMHVGGQVSFLDRVGVHVSLPVSLFQGSSSGANAAVTAVGPSDSPAVADLRAGLRVRIFGHADRDPVSLHLGANLWAPIGSRASNTGDEDVRVEPRLTLAGRGGPVRWSFTGSFVVRSEREVTNLVFGNELRLTAGVGLVFANERFMIGPEGYVVTPIRDLPTGASALFAKNQSGGEIHLGASYLIADALRVGVAAGPGIGTGPGIPDVRAVFNVSYAPITRAAAGVADTDDDGVSDPEDLCPTVPMGPNPDPRRRGCPIADTDGDGVFDGEDQCINDPMGPTPDPARRGCPLRDRDGDGVMDTDDVCPEQPQGATPDPTRRGCPAGDRDGDQVLDHEDQCPDQSRMPFPDAARVGCPLPDADRDQVPEPPDACPGVPGVPSPDPARNGCPSTQVRMEGGRILILEQVFFDTDRDTIKRRSFRVLQAVADVLRAAQHIRRVSVDGHTDNRASEEHNLDLSRRRAASVVRWLTEHGVESGRLESQGYGPSRPLDTNATGAGRARNRRVEFVIIDPPQPRDATPMVTPPPQPDAPAGHGHGRRRHHRRH